MTEICLGEWKRPGQTHDVVSLILLSPF